MQISVSVSRAQKQLLATYAVVVIVALLWGISVKLGHIETNQRRVVGFQRQLVQEVQEAAGDDDDDRADRQDDDLDEIMEELEE